MKNLRKTVVDNSGPQGPRARGMLYAIKRDKYLILMSIPSVLLLIVFSYLPIYGIIIAFRNYSIGESFFSLAHWVGLDNFTRLFQSPYASRIVRNTIMINLYAIALGFPVPIIFALALNEIKNASFKKISQTISYLPHFISVVIVCGLVVTMLSPNGGILNKIAQAIAGKYIDFFLDSSYFRLIYVISDIWTGFGWGSILYLSAIAGIDQPLYEAAHIDGASRLQCIFYITLPGIAPTVTILLILTISGIFNLGAEKIILLYNPAIYETSDVIATYVYRVGLIGGQYSFAAAVGLMNSIISIVILYIANKVCQKIGLASFW